MILIINNQSQLIRHLRDYLIELNIPFQELKHTESLDSINQEEIKGVILSGGPGNPYGPLNLTPNFVVLANYQVPILGICLGHEIINVAFGEKLTELLEYQDKMQEIILTVPKDPIFEGLFDKLSLKKHHLYHSNRLPNDFIKLAYSETCPLEIIKHKEKPIYGFQSHPEASGEDGKVIFRNFLKLCGVFN